MQRLFRPLIGGLLALLLTMAAPALAAVAPVKAPEFRLTAMDGKTLRLSQFKGKWVVVKFWAPWCPLCFSDVPELNALNARKDVVVIGVAMDYGPDVNSVQAAIQRVEMRYHAQVLGGRRVDSDSPHHQIGAVNFYPTTYLFAPDGAQAAVMVGPLRVTELEALIATHRTGRARGSLPL
ncbi:MAG: TlpA family protein disulfide reductase [Thiobacillaceae bacterium]|jgi:thiol-disulfide isomerase/thioredoxin|nr:TlpA family protein disulfide reductase [Thiobacillaceae bacterium]